MTKIEVAQLQGILELRMPFTTLHYYHYTKDLLTAYLMKLYQQGEKTINIYCTGQLAEITYYAGMSTPLKLNAIITGDPSQKLFPAAF